MSARRVSTEDSIIVSNNEQFLRATYNGINVIVREKDGYINGNSLTKQFNKDFYRIKEHRGWGEFLDEIGKYLSQTEPLTYKLGNKYDNDTRGTYIHPKLVNYVAMWASPRYCVYVCDIMDSINNKVHEVLEEKELPDTVENVKPILANVVSTIAPSIGQSTVEASLWCCRDSAFRLDSYEKQDLKSDIDEYNSIKNRLKIVEEKVDKWGAFVEKYHPEFSK